MSVIDSTIDGRYQILTRIASGGMGDVYRAQDVVLGREVALKTLHPQFAGDDGFVNRFRREARASAILSHRNIVAVHDWGSTDGTYFMVMEFIRGTNLRSLLTEHGRLEPAQVVEVALQVMSALDHAHAHGIVHRDIKPENILIDADGTVKVADFGLARAFADASVSQVEGTVTGTVQYLGPEQIEGRPADPRTDIYSFGIVLFELLTGRPPFTGETSLAIAYQHVSSRVPPPSTVVAGVPLALDQAVSHATEKDPAARPESARSFRDEIARAGVGLPPALGVSELAAQLPSTRIAPGHRASTVTVPRIRPPRHVGTLRSRRIAASAGALALIIVLGWAVWAFAIPRYENVPAVRGSTVARAEEILGARGFSAAIGRQEYSAEVEAGLVLRTIPAAGARLETDSGVVLILSRGPELFEVPRVIGVDEQAARDLLEGAGFRLDVRRDYSDAVPEGRVMAQNPNSGQQVLEGSVVTMTVSLGPPPVSVPSLAGQTASAAEKALRQAGFFVVVVEENSPTVEQGAVVRTDPIAGTEAPRGSTVLLVVSLGPRTFAMPDVRSSTREDALEVLGGLGLTVDVTVVPGSVGDE
ncbi:MAG: Stk1 family PASTA domain-containing Ser/Thr kinase, partial [Actinobacteria bacterium]|nr:Stk1 family PASTA domain-containing Ser/Thr kinase [Actinomycetota bacterium]